METITTFTFGFFNDAGPYKVDLLRWCRIIFCCNIKKPYTFQLVYASGWSLNLLSLVNNRSVFNKNDVRSWAITLWLCPCLVWLGVETTTLSERRYGAAPGFKLDAPFSETSVNDYISALLIVKYDHCKCEFRNLSFRDDLLNRMLLYGAYRIVNTVLLHCQQRTVYRNVYCMHWLAAFVHITLSPFALLLMR